MFARVVIPLLIIGVCTVACVAMFLVQRGRRSSGGTAPEAGASTAPDSPTLPV